MVRPANRNTSRGDTMDGDDYTLTGPPVLVDLGDSHLRLETGAACSGVPAGALESLVRRGMACLTAGMRASDSTPSDAPAADWRSTGVESLGLQPAAVAALTAAGMVTVADLLRVGAENGSLTSIKGIGRSTEQDIKAAITRLSSGH